LIPLVNKEVKAGKSEEAIFKLFSSGIKTQRDEWVYDLSKDALENKVKFLISVYQDTLKDGNNKDKNQIKWDRELTKYLDRKINKEYSNKSLIKSCYRPYFKQYFYLDKHFNGMTYQWFNIYSASRNNKIIAFNIGGIKFAVVATDTIIDLGSLLVGGGSTQCLPLYSYDTNGNRIDNITDWGLHQFQTHYNDTTITKEDIFYYTYSVLHNPEYRTKYELNLKRDFPRLPFYENFSQRVNWGKKLMELHINYETIKLYPLKRIDIPLDKPKPKLKADKPNGRIILDDVTTLENIPVIAWEYRLGNRSALEWILDQYKEKKPKDQTIAEKFNTYRFADYKEQVIDLLCRVCTVSVETMEIIQKMDTK
jgi:predicted helicase